jgi:hypothetical protein
MAECNLELILLLVNSKGFWWCKTPRITVFLDGGSKAITVTSCGGPHGCGCWGSCIFQTIGSQMTLRLSALRAIRLSPPGRFLVLISARGWVDPKDHSAAGSISSIEKPNDLFGNRTRDLPACSIMPQPTMLLCAPFWKVAKVQNPSNSESY